MDIILLSGTSVYSIMAWSGCYDQAAVIENARVRFPVRSCRSLRPSH